MTEQEALAAIYALTPREFERFVAQLLIGEGYKEVKVQGGPDDRGIDIKCRDQNGQLVAVQCKRFAPASTVSAIVVQHLAGMAVKSGVHQALLVTTATFTSPATNQARAFDVDLMDGPTLARKTLQNPGLKGFVKLETAPQPHASGLPDYFNPEYRSKPKLSDRPIPRPSDAPRNAVPTVQQPPPQRAPDLDYSDDDFKPLRSDDPAHQWRVTESTPIPRSAPQPGLRWKWGYYELTKYAMGMVVSALIGLVLIGSATFLGIIFLIIAGCALGWIWIVLAM